METFDLAAYLTSGVENIVKNILCIGEMRTGEHSGGCVLFEQRESVEAILKEEPTHA